jgi:TetR/AcrR family transcriptional repressor of nem operon
MRYSATHKTDTRKHLLKTAGALAKEKGFSSTGVDALMAAAGLTSGAFYNHFSSKTELFSELLKRELDHSFTMFADELSGESVDEWIARQLKRYLNWKHVQSPASGCVVPSLGAEIGRADKPAKKIFEDGAKRTQKVWAEQLGDEKMAWAVISQLVGSVLLARAMASEKTSKEVLDASKEVLTNVLAQLDSRKD